MVKGTAIHLVVAGHRGLGATLRVLTLHRSIRISPRSGLCQAHSAPPNTPLRLAHVNTKTGVRLHQLWATKALISKSLKNQNKTRYIARR